MTLNETTREKAAALATPAMRKAVAEYQQMRRKLRREYGPKWMEYVDTGDKEDLEYLLRMHQWSTIVWMADHKDTSSPEDEQ